MKTKFIAILFMAFATVTMASDMPTVSNFKSKTLVITTNSWNGGTLEIMIKDAENAVIHSEKIKNEKIARSYNVKNLPDGKYMIEMTNGLKTTKQNFEIYSSEVFLDSNVETSYAAVVNVKGDFVDVNAYGAESVISILDQNGNELVKELVPTLAVHRRFNVAKLPAGSYTVVVANSETTNTHSFDKK
jgi:hypothetical protein